MSCAPSRRGASKKKRPKRQNRLQPQTAIERRRLIDPFEQSQHRRHRASANTKTSSGKTSARGEECSAARLARFTGWRPFSGSTCLSSASSCSKFQLLCQHNKSRVTGGRQSSSSDPDEARRDIYLRLFLHENSTTAAEHSPEWQRYISEVSLSLIRAPRHRCCCFSN